MAFFGLEAYGSDDEKRPSLSDFSDSDSDSEDAAAAIVAAAPVALGPEPPPEKSKPVSRSRRHSTFSTAWTSPRTS